MNIDNLVKMANNIADFFKAEPVREDAISGVVEHLLRFWESRMRVAIIQHYRAGGAGLSDIAREAVARMAQEQDAPAPVGQG